MKQESQNARKSNPYIGFLWGILIVLFLNGLIFPIFGERRIVKTDYGTFISKVDSGKVKEVMIKNGQIYFSAKEDKERIITYQTGETNDPQLVERLLEAHSPNENGKISFSEIVPQENSPLMNFVLYWILPGLIFYLIWRQAGKMLRNRMGGGNFMSFGGNEAKIYADSEVKTTFADVAGQDEAKEALTEIVGFLHNPEKYTKIGATLPKGALLVGPPGTGKTLIAQAVAGEAKVPFFAMSGSEFVQMFVGMGAAKVRDLFQQASQKAPCIIFIDEIDGKGKYAAIEKENEELRSENEQIKRSFPEVLKQEVSKRTEKLSAEKRKAEAERQTLIKERDKVIRLLNEQKANEQQHIDRAVHEAIGRQKAITEELQWKSALLNALADLLYRTVEVFRRAVAAIIDFATSQYKSVFSPSEAADIKEVMRSYGGEDPEQQKSVGK